MNGDVCEKCLVPAEVVQVGSASGREHLRCPDCGAQWRKKNPQAMAMGALGGRAAAKSMTKEERVARGEKAANARWHKEKHA